MKVRVVKDHFCGTGWRAEPETLYLGGVGAVYVEKLEFELPEEWDGLAVTLHIEQEGGTVPQPMLLDGNNNAPVDGRFTTARQGLWMLMATDGEGRREMTMPGKYVCYQTLKTARELVQTDRRCRCGINIYSWCLSRKPGQRWKHREPPDTGSGWPTDALQRNTRYYLKR